MFSRLHTTAISLMAPVALAGCVQATRHSNTMVFGTNTRFGISAGISAASTPEVNVGYARQEAVVMPLVANSRDDGTYQSPCDPSQPVDAGGAKFAVHPCLLVALNGDVQDSYSVLASFGAKFDGSANVDGAGASGGLAQYFATGAAAQILALNGGASVVAVGTAAEKAAETKADAGAVNALFGSESDRARGVGHRDAYTAFQAKILAKIDLTPDDQIQKNMTTFEAAAGVTGRGIAPDCDSPAACRKSLIDNQPYRDIYLPKQAAFDQALVGWKVQ